MDTVYIIAKKTQNSARAVDITAEVTRETVGRVFDAFTRDTEAKALLSEYIHAAFVMGFGLMDAASRYETERIGRAKGVWVAVDGTIYSVTPVSFADYFPTDGHEFNII